MKETQLLGKLLPTHPDILPILEEIREKYQIPPITPHDDSLKILVQYELEIDWEAVYAEIMERLKETDLLPEKTKKAYNAIYNLKTIGLVDPELEKLSEEFRNGLDFLIDMFVQQYEPLIAGIDGVYQELTNHCLEYLLTGEAREVPEEWFTRVDVMDAFGEKIIFAMANQATNPDEIADMFKAKYLATFGKHRPNITEKHVKTADFLRMRWEGKSIAYLLEEEDILADEKNKAKSSNRHSTTTRKRHARMRQDLHRLKKTIYKLVA